MAAGKPGKLRIKAGYVANETWQIRVMAGDRKLLETNLGGKPQPGWERYELDLTPLAGKEFTLEVIATSPDGAAKKTLWKRLEVQQ